MAQFSNDGLKNIVELTSAAATAAASSVDAASPKKNQPKRVSFDGMSAAYVSLRLTRRSSGMIISKNISPAAIGYLMP